MAYTIAWNEASPLGSDPANTLHTIIQNKQIATRERLAGIFGLTAGEWAADPIVPKSLNLSVSLTAPIVTGNVVGNVTGNLTGTVLTAAQANITSVGVLTSLVVNGVLTANTYVDLRGNVSGSVDAIYFATADDGKAAAVYYRGTGAAERWRVGRNVLSSAANNAFEFYNTTNGIVASISFTTGILSSPFGFSGNLTGTILTAAQGNITSLGSLTNLTTGSITSTANGAILDRSGASTGVQYIHLANTSGDLWLAIESSVAGATFTGSLAYASILYSTSQPLQIITGGGAAARTQFSGLGVTVGGTITVNGQANMNGNIVMSNNTFLYGQNTVAAVKALIGVDSSNKVNIDAQALGVVMTGTLNVTGAITGNLTGNLTGTVLTAAQGNITSLGTLTGLLVANAQANINVTSTTGTNDVYTHLHNTGGDYYVGVENSAGSSFGATAYDFVIYTPHGLDFRINKTTGIITAASGVTANVTGNLTGTVLTAAQGNITSLGTLTSLTVSGNVTVGSLSGLPAGALGAQTGATCTLAKLGAGAAVTTAAQQKWLQVVGSDAVTYQIPAFT